MTMMTVCDLCGNKIPDVYGKVHVQLSDWRTACSVGERRYSLEWDLCDTCAGKVFKRMKEIEKEFEEDDDKKRTD